jgi:hypothetical protein
MLRRFALVYLGFAIGHVSWKVFKIVRARRRVAEALANVDGWELHMVTLCLCARMRLVRPCRG